MLKIEIATYDALPCECHTFMINDICASQSDFGECEDLSPVTAEEYGCGNRQFVPRMPTKEVLKKYNIDVDEYSDICTALKAALDVGKCGWWV